MYGVRTVHIEVVFAWSNKFLGVCSVLDLNRVKKYYRKYLKYKIPTYISKKYPSVAFIPPTPASELQGLKNQSFGSPTDAYEKVRLALQKSHVCASSTVSTNSSSVL